MKEYPEIPSWKNSPLGLPCIAFEKLDGSNLRFEYNKKRGWYKFGTRQRLFDGKDPEFGKSIETFLSKYGDIVPKILRDYKPFREIINFVVFCEFVGEHSFAGVNDFSENIDVVMIDVSLYKMGIMEPKLFVSLFSNLHIPAVVYRGNFNRDFITNVKEGKFQVKEGVVAKGIIPGRKPPHGLWMAKVKTNWWINELINRSKTNKSLSIILREEEKNI